MALNCLKKGNNYTISDKLGSCTWSIVTNLSNKQKELWKNFLDDMEFIRDIIWDKLKDQVEDL